MKNQLLVFILFTALITGACSDENSNAVFGAHPADWLDAHPGNIEYGIDNFIAECGICHSLDLRGTPGAPSCYSASYNSNSCHASGPVPHKLDGSFLDENNHGPLAKSDLTLCQACHSDNPTGGPGSNPQFNVGINSASGTGCESALCHSTNMAHPDTWAGPSNDRYHYSAGNIQQACTLCHGAAFAGSNCIDCHAETTDFTLDCNACHDLPPTGTTDHSTITDPGPTVADIGPHNVCATCHGVKESAGGGEFSNNANYALFNKTTDTIGDHWDGNINMNSDTDYVRSSSTGGCDTAGCHDGLAPHTLPTSSYPLELGAYGVGAPHDTDLDWLLPAGHVASFDATCIPCHTLAGGGQDPACEDCHVNNLGNNPILANCVSCHAEPPNLASTNTADRPNRQGAHNDHDNFTASTLNCSACHDGGGTGELSHYDRSDQTTPNYPAEVNLLASFNSNNHGSANYSGATCSGVNCHGGLTTPSWLTGTLNVNTQCTNCHQRDTVGGEDNSYTNPDDKSHTYHLGNPDGVSITCTSCHNTTKLATTHFTNLGNPAQWLDSPGSTIGGSGTRINDGNYTDSNNSCTPQCHSGDTETW